jgi:hypothetical protein
MWYIYINAKQEECGSATLLREVCITDAVEDRWQFFLESGIADGF